MSLNVRRVVTDHDERGRSKVAIDERCADVISRRPGHESCVAWTGTDGTIFRVVEYQPGEDHSMVVVEPAAMRALFAAVDHLEAGRIPEGLAALGAADSLQPDRRARVFLSTVWDAKGAVSRMAH
jgi:hypothetical protein